jgi:nitrite reductase/ring-hydroxylating ferredoxin subunit
MAEEYRADRREFLLNLGVVGGLIIAGGGALHNAIRFIVPAIRPLQYIRLRATTMDRLEKEGAAELTLLGQRIIVQYREGEVRAFSGICTHLGCQVKWQADKDRFFCPCHLGVFDPDGQVVSGPPPRPLDRFEVEVVGNNVFVHVPDVGEGGV